ncbi:MAG: DUF2231 domain-containing protein [Acidobacteriota bacterium]
MVRTPCLARRASSTTGCGASRRSREPWSDRPDAADRGPAACSVVMKPTAAAADQHVGKRDERADDRRRGERQQREEHDIPRSHRAGGSESRVCKRDHHAISHAPWSLSAIPRWPSNDRAGRRCEYARCTSTHHDARPTRHDPSDPRPSHGRTRPAEVVAYVLARALRSARWAFVADVTLYACALVTVATAAFGLTSYFVLDWPGGLSPWNGLHLAFGAATLALLVALAIYRIGSHKSRPFGGMFTIGGSLAIGAVVAFTGWIGGEMLVYRSGMAVEAAGDGALAPPTRAREGAPHPDNMLDAMHDLRASWAQIESCEARMIVENPGACGFDPIARQARRISTAAIWVAAHMHGDDHATELAKEADGLGASASKQDLAGVVRSTGELAATCAGCHVEKRWHHGPSQEQPAVSERGGSSQPRP